MKTVVYVVSVHSQSIKRLSPSENDESVRVGEDNDSAEKRRDDKKDLREVKTPPVEGIFGKSKIASETWMIQKDRGEIFRSRTLAGPLILDVV